MSTSTCRCTLARLPSARWQRAQAAFNTVAQAASADQAAAEGAAWPRHCAAAAAARCARVAALRGMTCCCRQQNFPSALLWNATRVVMHICRT